MNNKWRIPANFKIPRRYERRFVFRGRRGILRMTAVGGKRAVELEQSGIIEPEERSEALDWIQEAVEWIRAESKMG